MTHIRFYPKGKAMSKYGNTKTVLDGHTFDSKAEAKRYQELKLLEKAQEIFNLELQPKFTLVPKTKKRRAITYTADFAYNVEINNEDCENCEFYPDKCGDCRYKVVVEDVKSPATAKDKTYIVKRNLFEYQNPNVDFREVLSC